MKQFNLSAGIEHVGDDPSKMNAFLATVRFDSILKEHGINIADSWRLIRGEEQRRNQTHVTMSCCVKQYFLKAFRACQRNPVVTSHSVQGSRLRLCLERNTLERYESELLLLLKFTQNCANEKMIFVPSNVAEKTESLVPALNGDTEDVLTKMQALMCTLFLDIIEPRKGDVGFIGVYVACASVVGGPTRASLRYGEASEVSPVLAALKYCVRVIAVMEVIGYGETMNGVESWKFMNARTADPLIDTGATYLAYISHLAHSIIPSESARCRFRICAKHEKCGFMDNVEISLPVLGQSIRKIQELARLTIELELLKGLDLGNMIFTEASGMDDALQNSSNGFWFGQHPANARCMLKWSAMLWSHRGSDFWSKEGLQLNVAACNEFLDGREKLQRYLFSLAQLTGGSPSRASECAGLRVMNDTAASRNVFLCDGQLVLTSFYSKTRSLNDGASKPIARFPDSVTQAYFLVYLLILRPLEYCIVKSLHEVGGGGCGEAEDQRIFLFARRGEALSAKVLCTWFKETLAEAGIEDIGVSQYRQYQTGMLKNFGLGGRTDADFATHAQAGHSEETAHRLYGVSDADFRHLTGTELEAYRVSSQKWQEALGIEHGSAALGAMERGNHGEHKQVAIEIAASDGQIFEQNIGSVLLQRMESVEKLLTHVLSLKRARYFDEDDRGQDRLYGASKRERCIPGARSEKEQKYSVSTDLKEALGLFLRAPEGSNYDYKSSAQREAVELSRRRETDGLIVLPTGGGKSLVFMLPCYVENLSISVVIVPLIALQRDMLARCTRAGIDAVLWRDRERVGIRIVIASVEHLETEEYAKFIRTVYGSGKLGRIVIDEAHLVCMWSHFRSKMHGLAACVRPRGVQVPIIMLTATAPPEMVTTITSMCGVDVVDVIRAPSCRPNIRYSCVQMDSGSSAASFQIAVADKVIAIVNKFRSDLVKSRVIVYMLTRATVEGLASLIGRDPRTCAYSYHAGMDEECRQRSQDGWSSDVENIKKFKVMIKTSAFGTGIDHPGIRAVIHVMGARSLLEFYQESGRAGRDGCVAESVVLHLAHRGTNGFCFGDEGESVHLQSHQGQSTALRGKCFGDFRKYVDFNCECRRRVVEGFCDGEENYLKCTDMKKKNESIVLCDMCENMGGKRIDVDHEGSENSSVDVPMSTMSPPEKSSPKSASHNMCEAGRDIAESAKGAQARRLSAELEVESIRRLALKMENVCSVCTVSSGTEVRHQEMRSASDMRLLPCRRNRCDRCGTRGHYWDSCTLNPKPAWNQGCTRCGLSKHLGLAVHPEGQFGKPSCGLATIASMALLSWENEEKRSMMRSMVSELNGLESIEQFSVWLRCSDSASPVRYAPIGLVQVVAYIDGSYCSGKFPSINGARKPSHSTSHYPVPYA